MSSKKRLNKIEQAQREAELMNSPVRMDGVGEDPVIQDLLSDKFVEGTNVEASNIALALQQLLRGQNAILNMQQGQGEAITKLTKRMDQMDKAAKAWETDRANFLEGVQERADPLLIKDPAKKAAFMAREAKRVQREIQNAVANKAVTDLEFTRILESQPKVTITSYGTPITVNRAGVVQMEMEPEVIKIRNKQWILQPGVPTDVPKLVADEWFSRQKIRQDTAERQKLLDANRPIDNVIMAQKWNSLNAKYGSDIPSMVSDNRE